MRDLAPANAVLATFAPGWQFRRGRRGLWLRGPGGPDIPVRLRRSDRLWFVRRRVRYFGGTAEQAVCLLALWIRDQPRRPLRCWRHLCSGAVGLGGPETLRLLEEGDYGDPAKTRCVLCGDPDPGDWWSLDGVVGPCCSFGRCRREVTRGD